MGYGGSSGISVAILQHTLAAGRGPTGRLTDLQKLDLLIFDCSLGYAKKDNTRTQSHCAAMMLGDVMARVANLIVL